MPKWCDAKVAKKQVWTEGLFTISVSAPGLIPHKPGQFLHLALPGEGDKIINRPYSVASPAGDQVEFFIVMVEDGQLTPRLWALEEGDHVMVSERPAGRFTLDHAPKSETIWLMSTGTGLAPYIAMLREPQIWDEYRKIVVAHGVRYGADLGYADELRAFQEQHPGRFAYVGALTREEKQGTLSGRLPALVSNGQLEEATGFRLEKENSTVLVCGNPAMLNDMESTLGERGMIEHRKKTPGQIVLERYW